MVSYVARRAGMEGGHSSLPVHDISEKPAANPGPIARALPGMIARGHGLETLCLYLAVTEAVLLNLVVALALPTPHNRPHRRPSGRNPWRPDDVTAFISLWLEGWAAGSLAQRFGRSKAGMWSKARALGLPRRPRTEQFVPADAFTPVLPGLLGQTVPLAGRPRPTKKLPPHGAYVTPNGNAAPRPIGASSIQNIVPGLGLVSVLPDRGNIAGATLPLGRPDIVRKGLRQEVDWVNNPQLDDEVAMRSFARQHYLAAARDMGIPKFAFLSRRLRLEIPGKKMAERGWRGCVDEFRPEWAQPTIDALGYEKVRCRGYATVGISFHFWRPVGKVIHYSAWWKSKSEWKTTPANA